MVSWMENVSINDSDAFYCDMSRGILLYGVERGNVFSLSLSLSLCVCMCLGDLSNTDR